MVALSNLYCCAQSALGCLVSNMSPLEERISPKVLVIAMFDQEAANWLSPHSEYSLQHQIHVPGLSHGYETVHCTTDKNVCLMVTGIALVNAALSLSALTNSANFDFRKTYFILSGIGGVNPKLATIGSVAVARFAIQVDVQLEFDAREIPENWTTGYVPMGAPTQNSWPDTITGSEVFELNDNLRKLALSFGQVAKLNDSKAAADNRALYIGSPHGVFDAATSDPRVIEGDVTSSNIFFHGHHLSEGVENAVNLYTSGLAMYVMTAMEDTATLAALLRAAVRKQVDFSRIILMRAGSNFDRSHSMGEVASLPFVFDHGGFAPACRNLYLTGLEVINGILEGWNHLFDSGVRANNYVGDIFGSLGGKPDFVPKPAPSA